MMKGRMAPSTVLTFIQEGRKSAEVPQMSSPQDPQERQMRE